LFEYVLVRWGVIVRKGYLMLPHGLDHLIVQVGIVKEGLGNVKDD